MFQVKLIVLLSELALYDGIQLGHRVKFEKHAAEVACSRRLQALNCSFVFE